MGRGDVGDKTGVREKGGRSGGKRREMGRKEGKWEERAGRREAKEGKDSKGRECEVRKKESIYGDRAERK